LPAEPLAAIAVWVDPMTVRLAGTEVLFAYAGEPFGVPE
jgi:hypothetical protein